MSGFIPIIFVVFAVALAVGPIMLMRPTTGQKRLASIRTAAAERGLMVSSEKHHVLYILPWRRENGKKTKADFDEWRLAKQNYSHGAHYFNDWDWEGRACPDSSIRHDELRRLLASSESYAVLGGNRIGVYLGWNERLGGEGVDKKLDELQRDLNCLSKVYVEA